MGVEPHARPMCQSGECQGDLWSTRVDCGERYMLRGRRWTPGRGRTTAVVCASRSEQTWRQQSSRRARGGSAGTARGSWDSVSSPSGESVGNAYEGGGGESGERRGSVDGGRGRGLRRLLGAGRGGHGAAKGAAGGKAEEGLDWPWASTISA